MENSALGDSNNNGSGDESFDYVILENSISEDINNNDNANISSISSQLLPSSNSSLLDKVIL